MKIIKLFLPLIFAVIFFSCSKNEDVVTNNNGGTGTGSESFTGVWTVDQVQMLQAPVGSGVSAMMKQALQVYGSVSASSVGYADITFGQTTWSRTPLTGSLSNIQVKGSTIISYDGAYLQLSIDGLLSKSTITMPNGTQVLGVSLMDENTIFAAQNDAAWVLHLYKSVNKGASWTEINSHMADSSNGGELVFVNNSTGYYQNFRGLYKTTNGGVTWSLLNTHEGYYHLQFFDENRGVMTGGYDYNYSKYKVTANGGVTWTEYTTFYNSSFRSSFFLDANNAWVLNYNSSLKSYVLSKSNDGGASWSVVNQEIPDGSTGMRFMNSNEGYLNKSGLILKTTNGGVTWIAQSTANNSGNATFVNYNGNPIAAYSGYTLRPGSFTDSTKWVLQGKVTNSIYKALTDAPNYEIFANGSYQRDGNTVIFSVANYSGPGPDEKIGSGTFSFESGFLNINLQFPNEERWKIKLRKK
jgi:photosystem II stability/assembly factor-like uncharacterized protein